MVPVTRPRSIDRRLMVLLIFLSSLMMLSGCTIPDTGEATPTATPEVSPPDSTPTGPSSDSELQNRFKNLYESSIDSVVSIEVFSGGQEGRVLSRGTGFVYDENGYIVTNQHVLNGGEDYEVTFHDGIRVNAEFVGSSVYNDLAILKVDPEEHSLEPLPMGDSEELQPGTIVVALGNPLGFESSMTHGIVSGVNRLMQAQGGFSLPGVIQTDAPINPGNSGGPLLTLDGKAVGVNRAKAQAENIGFAIPSDIVKQVVPVLIEEGEYKYPWIGIRTFDVNPEIADAMGLEQARGVEVAEVVPNSPADRAGLQGATDSITVHGTEYSIGGDIIVAIDDEPVRTIDDVLSYLALHTSVGDTVTLHVIRDGRDTTVDLTLGERPEP